MNNRQPEALETYIAGEIEQLTSACTRCGKCVEVCPVVPFSEAAGKPAKQIVSSIVESLQGNATLDSPSADWMHSCNGCGECIDTCPEKVNPRKMLMLANVLESTIASRTPQLFRKMTRGIKLMAAMQLVPAEYTRLFAVPPARPAPYVFYLGCNALRTPHLLFNSMQVLDALDLDYEVVGGPASCCGVISTKWEGQVKVGQRVTNNTIKRFEGFTPERVLNWCPTCQLHLGETLEGFRQTSYSFDHLTAFLVERSDELIARFRRRIDRTVVLHAHVGHGQVGRDVQKLLSAIPGLTVVETVFESGYTCGGSGCSRSPGLQAVEHAHLLERAKENRADILVTLYHGCHSSFVGAEREGEFRVLNFTDLLVEALGGEPHDDRLKHLALIGDMRGIAEEARPYLAAHGIDIDPDWLSKNLGEILSAAEFKGGLDCFGGSDRAAGAVDRVGDHPSHRH